MVFIYTIYTINTGGQGEVVLGIAFMYTIYTISTGESGKLRKALSHLLHLPYYTIYTGGGVRRGIIM